MVIYNQRSTAADERIKQLLADAYKLIALCEDIYNKSTEPELLVGCLSEQTVIEKGLRQLSKKKEGPMNLSLMQNPFAPEAKYIKRAGKEHRGVTSLKSNSFAIA